MIKSLKIERFQSHRDLKMGFHPGITGIIGTSMSGKTAILRALRWIATNRPSGFRFHSRFSKKATTTGTIEFDNGSVTLIKTGSKSQYIVDKEKTYQGREVPDVVQKLVNFDELNIQDQLEPPYLVTGGPSALTHAIHNTLQTNRLDGWLKAITRRINKLSATRDSVNKDIKYIDSQLEKLEGIEDVADDIRELISVSKKIERVSKDLNELNSFIESIREAEEYVQMYHEVLRLKNDVKKYEKVQKKIDLIEEEYTLIEKINQVEQSILLTTKEGKKWIRKYVRKIKENKQCPTCLGDIDEETTRRIKNEISVIE